MSRVDWSTILHEGKGGTICFWLYRCINERNNSLAVTLRRCSSSTLIPKQSKAFFVSKKGAIKHLTTSAKAFSNDACVKICLFGLKESDWGSGTWIMPELIFFVTRIFECQSPVTHVSSVYRIQDRCSDIQETYSSAHSNLFFWCFCVRKSFARVIQSWKFLLLWAFFIDFSPLF